VSADFREWSGFFWPRTEVLRNKLGLHDQEDLEQAERRLTFGRLVELRAHDAVPGSFDLAHFQAVHAYVFQDVYEWAGQLRAVTLTKGGSEFCRPEHIRTYAEQVFSRLAINDLLCGLDVEPFVYEAAEVLGDINALHPFREGNGRSQRAFIELLSDNAGHPIVWPSHAEERNVRASLAAMHGDNSGLRELIAEGLPIRASDPPPAHDDAPLTAVQSWSRADERFKAQYGIPQQTADPTYKPKRPGLSL
jgi:cell filamentation protein